MWVIPGPMILVAHIARATRGTFSPIVLRVVPLYSERCLIGQSKDTRYFSQDRIYREGANIKVKSKLQILKLCEKINTFCILCICRQAVNLQ